MGMRPADTDISAEADCPKFNFSNGTPPYITAGHYDVPIPDSTFITEWRRTSLRHVRAMECYIGLCQLTEVIGDILPLLYHIRSGNDAVAAKQVSKSEADIVRWSEALPSWLSLTDFHHRPDVPGLPNLQLSYLAVKMLLARIAWHDISSKEVDPHPSWLLNCQAAADEVVRFILSLHPIDFRGFWLPHNAQHFTTAVTLLLRCALQTSNNDVRKKCMQNARKLVDFLRRAKNENNWDLTEMCLATAEQVLRRIEEALSHTRLDNSPFLPPHEQCNTSAPSYGSDWATNQIGMQQYDPNAQMSIERLFPENLQ